MRAAPTNTAELIVLEWANCVSRLADVGTVGSNMPPWRPLLDFEKSCADGTQLTRILYYVLHAHDEKYLNANKIEPPGAELVPPELRVPHLWTRPLKDPQIDAFKADVFSNKDHANDLRDVLEDFAKRTLGLPAPLLKASDIQKQDAHWNFTVLSYLMLTSPGVRTNTHTQGVFEVVMALEEFGRTWRSVENEMNAPPEDDRAPDDDEYEEPAAKEERLNRLKAEKLIPKEKKKTFGDPGAQPKFDPKAKKTDAITAINMITDLLDGGIDLMVKINGLSASAHHGERLWEGAMRSVMERTVTEFTHRARMVETGGTKGFRPTINVPPRI